MGNLPPRTARSDQTEGRATVDSDTDEADMILLSQNGWPASKDRNAIHVKNYIVPGAKRHISCAEAAAPILVELAAWFHKFIEPIDTGTYDDWGWAKPVVIPGTFVVSNHGSGTAMDLNSSRHHWLSLKSGFTPIQEVRIRWKCRALGIRWGGDFHAKDWMHYEIIGTPAPVKARITRMKLSMPKEGTVK